MKWVSRITPAIAATLTDAELIYLKAHEACERHALMLVHTPELAVPSSAPSVRYILERAYGDVAVARQIAREVAEGRYNQQ